MNLNRVPGHMGPITTADDYGDDRCPNCDRPAEKKERVYECPKCGEVPRRFPDEPE